MVYSDDDDFAKSWDCDNWAAYTAKYNTPSQTTLTKRRVDANSIINETIGSWNVDIVDARFTNYLNQLEVEVINRMGDKKVDRKKGERGIYSPHDHLYQLERQKLKTIGMILGYIVPGAVG